MHKKQAPSMDKVEAVVHQILGGTVLGIERETQGVSTYVYRIETGKETLYLRILPEHEKSFAAEVLVHNLLLQKGVRVPEVVYFANCDESLGMSVMLVREIPGTHAGENLTREEYDAVLMDAGRQIALANQVPVDGYGWIQRGKHDEGTVLRGEHSEIKDVITEFLEPDLSFLSEGILPANEASRIRSILESGAPLMGRHEARLVHGDFDDSHIFQQHGAFTGIIDFGEIQGSSPLYDLGHFKIHDGQRYLGYPALAEGYREVAALSAEDQLEIDLWALWVGVRRLGIIGRRHPGAYLNHLRQAVRKELECIGSKL